VPALTSRTIAIVYPETDARLAARLRRGRRIARRMEPEEHAATLEVLERVPDAVASWSDGLAALEPFDIVEARRPLGSLSDAGGFRWWPAPNDCRRELDRHAPHGRYDAILVIWPAPPDLPLCGWGCSIGPSAEANGAGFSAMISDQWRRYPILPDPEEGFVHEWLHQIEARARRAGFDEDVVPPLHDAEILTSCRSADEPPFGGTYRQYHDTVETWRPWYHDWMTGRVRRTDGDDCFGLTRDRWQRLRPD
jgi:hypothetical protein